MIFQQTGTIEMDWLFGREVNSGIFCPCLGGGEVNTSKLYPPQMVVYVNGMVCIGTLTGHLATVCLAVYKHIYFSLALLTFRIKYHHIYFQTNSK